MHRILNFGDIELDAKKSPLALLAQTCSSIGKPESGSKPIIPPIEKKDVPSTSGSSTSSSDKKEGASSSSSAGKSTPDRVSPTSRHNAVSGRATSRDGGPVAADKSSLRAASTSPASSPNGTTSSYRPYGTPKPTTEDGVPVVSSGAPKDDNASFRTPRSSGGSHKGEKPSPTGMAPSSECSPKGDSSPSSSDAAASSSLGASSSSSSSSSSYPQSSSVPSTTSSTRLTEAAVAAAVAAEKSAASSSPKPPGASALAGLASAQAAGYSSLYPYGPMFDPSSPAFQAALAMHGGLFNHQAYLKSASSAPHHPPSCPHPGGCTQCEPSFPASAGFPPPPHPSLNLHHSAAAAAAAAALGLPYPFLRPGGLPPPPWALATTTASPFGSPYSSLNSQNAAGAAANSRLPFICNWVMPHDSFCGKRFATSEELLQHLRTHTSAANAAASEAAAAASSSSLLNSSYPGGFSQAAAMAAAFPGGLSAHSAAAAAAAAHALSSSALSSPNSPLRRTYPTSLSPVSRYHPYKPPSSSSVPSAGGGNPPPPFPGLPHFPGLGPYYSPYANLYGPRLGAPLAPP